MFTLQINGRKEHLDVDGEKPLVWVLREDLGLTGTKYCCGAGDCGVCTVHLDGEAAPSCRIPVHEAQHHRVLTIEGLVNEHPDHPVLRAWEEEAVPQCGYCQPGQVMAAAALLSAHPRPTPAQVMHAMDRVLCRCGSYARIHRAMDRLTDPAVR